MKIAVIGDRQTTSGFALLGIKRTRTPETALETEETLEAYRKDPDTGVIIIQEQYAEIARSTVRRMQRDTKMVPLIVEIPGAEGSATGGDDFLSMVQKTVGTTLRKEEEEK